MFFLAFKQGTQISELVDIEGRSDARYDKKMEDGFGKRVKNCQTCLGMREKN